MLSVLWVLLHLPEKETILCNKTTKQLLFRGRRAKANACLYVAHVSPSGCSMVDVRSKSASGSPQRPSFGSSTPRFSVYRNAEGCSSTPNKRLSVSTSQLSPRDKQRILKEKTTFISSLDVRNDGKGALKTMLIVFVLSLRSVLLSYLVHTHCLLAVSISVV